MGKRIWMLPETGSYYKTNLHCHSTVSDGAFTPAELKKIYQERGYHAIAYTDHKVCQPHPELTDENFVALSGVEIAFGIRQATSVHVCGIARNPMAELFIDNETPDDVEKINAGIRRLKEENYITTLNHPRWSGMLARTIEAIDEVDNMEVVNGFEMVQDGYGDSSNCFELELRRGRKVRPLATDDSHRESTPGQPGYEYFKGFTVIKAPELTYQSLIDGLDQGNFFASTGPMLKNLWIEDGTLHVDCSPVCGVYVHGEKYSHRGAVIEGSDAIESVDIDVKHLCEDSGFLMVQIVDKNGKWAWSVPHWFER